MSILNKITSTPSRAALILTDIVLFFSFPSYDVALVTNEMDAHWDAIFRQAKEPFVNHNHWYAEGTHEAKLSFRFVPAIIFNILRIHSLVPALVFQFLTVVLFYYLLILIFNKLFEDRTKAFCFALPICFIISGHVYISDYRGIFDTLALVFLLIALYFRNNIYVVIPLLLAYFTDERALIASPGLFLINIIERNSFEKIKSILNGISFDSNMYLFTSWVTYFALRFYLSVALGLTTDPVDLNLFLEQIGKSFYTIYIGLEGFIIPFGLIIYVLLKQRMYAFSALLILSFLLICWAAQSVFDIDRSMSYVLFVVIILLILIDKFFSKQNASNIILFVTVLNIVYIGSSYPFIAQLYRMKFITHSI